MHNYINYLSLVFFKLGNEKGVLGVFFSFLFKVHVHVYHYGIDLMDMNT